VTLEARGELLTVLLRIPHDLLGGLLQLYTPISDHSSRRVDTFHDAVYHGGVNLVVIFLQVLTLNARHAQVVVR